MEITGKLYQVTEAKTFETGRSIQEFYLDCTNYNPTTGEKRENYVKFQCWGGIINLSEFIPNDVIKVSFGIRGNWYTGRDGNTYFSQGLNAYRVEKVLPLIHGMPQQPQPAVPPTPAIPPTTGVAPATNLTENISEDDDLPF